MSAMQRTKGAVAERDFVAFLRANGYPDARRYLSGDGRQPGDVDGVPGVCIDVKNHQRLAIPEWLAQVEAEAPAGSIPVLAVRRPGLVDPGQWWAVTRWSTMLPLLAP